jgi:hypothetical protein
MLGPIAKAQLNMSCPSGGTFSVCTQGGSSNFIGCCGSPNPCSYGCPDGQLKPTSLNASYVGQVPDQICNIEAQFYQCADTSPPFWGCCKSNPCVQNGCPQGDLSPTVLSNVPSQYADYLGSSTTPTSGPGQKGRNSHTIIIVSVILGVAILVCLAITITFVIIKRQQRRRQLQRQQLETKTSPYPLIDRASKMTVGSSTTSSKPYPDM